MSLGHVYIVLEPVGSARLTFGDDRYYEFMCFDVPKVVRSPVCDHGHDEESRNGRYIKIDIFDDYVWTSERFRESSGIYRSTGGVTGTPRTVYRPLWALVEWVGGAARAGRAPPPPLVRIGLGRGVAPPFPSSLSPPSFSPSPTRERVESYSRRE